MPFWKGGLLFGLGATFDILKAACVCLIFLAPFVVGAAAGAIASTYASKLGCWSGAAAVSFTFSPEIMQAACDSVSTYAAQHAAAVGVGVGAAAAALTGVAEAALAPASVTVEALGIILAILLSLLGWLIIIFILILTGGFNPFEGGAAHFFVIFGAFLASVTPLVDAFPTFTPALWKIVRDMKKRDLKRYAEWKMKKKAYDDALARDRQARIGGAYAALDARERAEEERAAAEQEEREQEQREREREAAAREELEAVRSEPARTLVGIPDYRSAAAA